VGVPVVARDTTGTRRELVSKGVEIRAQKEIDVGRNAGTAGEMKSETKKKRENISA
jgi:hypothetical protein